MKVITSTTVRLLKQASKEGKPARFEHLPPGEHDLDDGVAKDLLKRGAAKTPAQAAKEAAPEKGPTVTKAAKAK